MSGSTSPTTLSASPGEASRDHSTQPSSPLEPSSPVERKNHYGKESGATDDKMEDEDDLEGMDSKAKALTNLLKTSSV
jgi:ATP-dependent DNA helicase